MRFVTNVSEQNENISTGTSSNPCRKFTNSSTMMSTLVTIIHVTIVVFNGAKWIWSKYYESDNNSWFYETSCKFCILCNRQVLDSLGRKVNTMTFKALQMTTLEDYTWRYVWQGQTFRQGYSTNTVTNKWVSTIHIHAKLRMANSHI